MKLAQRLVAARKKRGLSQVDLAKLLEVSPGTVGGWENGSHGIHLSRVEQVARVLKIKPSVLLADMMEPSA